MNWYYEEKWYVSILKWLGLMLLGTLGFVIFALMVMCFPVDVYHYEYIDLDDNKGIAKECSYEFTEGRAGGQGSPVCVLEDGTVKQVKEYKYVYEKTIVPIKEYWGDGNEKDNKK